MSATKDAIKIAVKRQQEMERRIKKIKVELKERVTGEKDESPAG